MVNRGGFSFIAMVVINPIVILFYQNCSMTPISHANVTQPKASISEVVAVKSKSRAVASTSEVTCPDSKTPCPNLKE